MVAAAFAAVPPRRRRRDDDGRRSPRRAPSPSSSSSSEPPPPSRRFFVSSSSARRSSSPRAVASPSSSSFSGRRLAVVVDASDDDDADSDRPTTDDDVVDVAIIGAGIGGLTAGAILSSVHSKTVGVYESHYLPGGCAHAFDRVAAAPSDDGNDEEGKKKEKKEKEKVTFTFDSGPTIVLGCSSEPYNPLRQVLNVVGLGEEVEWIKYDGWGMIERPPRRNDEGNEGKVRSDDDDDDVNTTKRWKMELGPTSFQSGPLATFGGPAALAEFEGLRTVTRDLVKGAVSIPAMAMRPGSTAIVPLLRYLPALIDLIRLGPELTQGTFGPYMDGPLFRVTDPWLRNWLDALAFSLSGLPASRTSAAAMAYVLYDMHRPDAALDYPKGGIGKVIDALVRGVQEATPETRSKVHLRRHVESIDFDESGTRATGLTLRGGRKVKAKEGVVCNVPVWSLNGLIANENARKNLEGWIGDETPPDVVDPRQSWISPPLGDDGDDDRKRRSVLRTEAPPPSNEAACDDAEMTGSFLHLHLALNSTGLNLDDYEAHYTVMDRGLEGDERSSEDEDDGPCGELNMIAVSNPCVLDRDLAPRGYIVVHAYGAGNEPYEPWSNLDRSSREYKTLKERRAEVLWRAVEAVYPDARSRSVLSLVGSPLTHERFLRRPMGTYGSATEHYLKDGSTPVRNLILTGDGIFPGIGVPAAALNGAAAANGMVGVFDHWRKLDELKDKGLLR